MTGPGERRDTILIRPSKYLCEEFWPVERGVFFPLAVPLNRTPDEDFQAFLQHMSNVQVVSLASTIEADVQHVTRVCPVRYPRAVRFLRRCACQRLATLIQEVLLSHGAAAIERWRRTVAAMSMAERKAAYLKYQGSSKMKFALYKVCVRRLAKAWIDWGIVVTGIQTKKKHGLHVASARKLQTVYRCMAARRRRDELYFAAKKKRKMLAAAAIVRCIKGKLARIRYATMKATIQRERAGNVLRRVGHGMIGRRKAQRMWIESAKRKVGLLFGMQTGPFPKSNSIRS